MYKTVKFPIKLDESRDAESISRFQYLLEISKNFENVYLEDFQSKNYSEKNDKAFLNKQVYNYAIGRLKFYLDYKSKMSAAHFELINPKYTSQICSNINCKCNYKNFVKKELSNRIHKCESCGLTLDRDVNAALNILQLGCNPDFRNNFQRIINILEKQKLGSRNRPIKNKKSPATPEAQGL
jgi:putative transposase